MFVQRLITWQSVAALNDKDTRSANIANTDSKIGMSNGGVSVGASSDSTRDQPTTPANAGSESVSGVGAWTRAGAGAATREPSVSAAGRGTGGNALEERVTVSFTPLPSTEATRDAAATSGYCGNKFKLLGLTCR